MSQSGSRTGGSGTGDDRESATDELISLIYGELDGEAAARVRERVAADPALSQQVSGLERVRAVVRSMDEDPPPRLSAQLLAEAARAVPASRRAADPSVGGPWSRFMSWLSPLVQRPAFAAAASLVLVAGVAGVLYLRKGDELIDAGHHTAKRLAPESAPTGASLAPVLPAAPSSPAPATPEEPASPTTLDRASASRDRRQNQPPPSKEVGRTDGLAQQAAKPAVAPKKSKKESFGSGGGAGLEQRESMDDADAFSSRTGRAYEPNEKNDVGHEGQGAAPPAAAAMRPQDPAADAPAGVAAQRRPTSPRDLHMRSVDAAADKRCSEVRALGDEIRALDASYYKTKFLSDKRLSICFENPSRAQKRK